jgi:single-strand DNA-binding protein
MKMPDKNVVIVEGNLTWDPVYFENEGRIPVCLLRIACNRRRKNRSTGAWEDHPRFFNVTVKGSRAKEVATTFAKGTKVLVNGYLDWYEKGDGDERREFVTIVAGNTPDGITIVPKAEKPSRSKARS